MDSTTLTAARAFITKIKAEPQVLHHPDLAFVKEYLESVGAKIPPAAPSTTLRIVSSLAEWDALVKEVGSKPIVVDFFAEWCGPCKAISPLFKTLAEKHSDNVVFCKIDVDVASDVAAKFGISAMPTFRVYKNGEQVDSVVGADQGKLKSMIEKAAQGGEKTEDVTMEEDGCNTGEAAAEEEAKKEPEPVEEEEVEEDDGGEDAVLEEMEKDPEVLNVEDRDVNPAPVPMGPMGIELSDADMDKQITLKGKASELAASGDLEGALGAWNEVIGMSSSPLTLAKRADVFLKLKQPYAAIRDCDAALEVNPDSAKSLKIRGMAYRLLGDWEKAAHDLQKGNQLDYDEKAGEVQRTVETRWNKIREYRLHKEAVARDRDVKKKAAAKLKAREEAMRQYEQQKKAEEEAEKASEMSGGMPGGMPGGAAGGMPGGKKPDAADIEKMIAGLDLPEDVQQKLKDPAVKAKLVKVFSDLQSNPSAAMGTAMKYMNDPEIGPILSAVMSSMMGGGMPGMGGGMPGMAAGGMPGMGGGMPGMGGGMPGMGGMPGGAPGGGMPGGGYGGNAADEVD